MGHCGQERGRERERSDQKLAKEEEKHTPSLRSPPQCPLAHPPSLIPQPHVHTEQTAEGGGWGVLLLMRRLDPGLPTAFLHFATAVNTTLFFPSRPHRRPQLPSNKVHGPAQGSKEKETANRFHGGRRVGPCQSYLNIQDEIMAKSSPDLARESSSPASLPLPAPWQPQNPSSPHLALPGLQHRQGGHTSALRGLRVVVAGKDRAWKSLTPIAGPGFYQQVQNYSLPSVKWGDSTHHSNYY